LKVAVLTTSEKRRVAVLLFTSKSNDFRTGDVESTTKSFTAIVFTPFTTALAPTPVISFTVPCSITKKELISEVPICLSFIVFRSSNESEITRSNPGDDVTTELLFSWCCPSAVELLDT
jgi:hypothetical protein